jgi:uncharacterized protein (DUF58 family)
MARFWLLCGLCLVFVVTGVATRNGSVIALALPVLMYLALSVLGMPSAPDLRIERSLSSARVVIDAETELTVRAENIGASIALIALADEIPHELAISDGNAAALTTLPKGAALELRYCVRGPRGEFDFDALGVEVFDPLMLRSLTLVARAPRTLLVEPRRMDLRDAEVRPERTRGFSGPIPARVPGISADFLNVREYQPGDRLRAINWRATVRMQDRIGATVYANQFEQQRIADIGLILDARESADVVTANGGLFEHSARATAALAESFLARGHRVGLMVYGAGIGMVYPGYGRMQRQRIFGALSRASTGHHFVFESLSEIPTRFFPPAMQLIYIGPCHHGDAVALYSLRARGYGLMAVCVDALEFERTAMPADDTPRPAVQLAHRIARVERQDVLRKLQRAGVQVVDWNVSASFEAALLHAQRTHPVQRVTRVGL